MRRVPKTNEPQVLAQNKVAWLEAYKEKPTRYRRYRYRHPLIKAALVAESSDKCVYCESLVGHNTPGDVEHKTPSSVNIELHFEWDNLTLACSECNRRKKAYFSTVKPFLDPNVDVVETRVVHYGPVVGWAHGDGDAEITVKTLEMHNSNRRVLLNRKIEKIAELNDKIARLIQEEGTAMGDLVRAEIQRMMDIDAEYSAMVRSLLQNSGVEV